MSNLSLEFLTPHLWRWVLLILPALALAFWTYYRILAPLSRPARWALWFLRGVAFLLVLLVLWQPVLSAVLRETGRPPLAILLDRSASMTLPGESGGGTRREESKRAAGVLRAELEDRFRLSWYSFSDHLHPAAPDSDLASVGNTAIGTALEEVLTASQNRPVSGIVLVSDGVNTGGRDPVRISSSSPVPIFTVAVGRDRSPGDVGIERVRTNPTAYAGEPLPIQAVLSSWGLAGRTARLEVREGETLLAGRDVPLIGSQGLQQEVSLEVRPRAPGLALFDIVVSASNDSVPQNDRRQVAVQVLERKTRVLLLAPRPDWDFSFLKRTLSSDTTLSYTFLAQLAPGQIRSYGERGPSRWPQSMEELRPFAAVLLVDMDEQGLPPVTLDLLARFTREGGGLLLIGGPGRAAPWASDGSMGRILPGRLQADPLPMAKSLPVSLTPEGQRHPATALRDNPAETAQAFAALPPLYRPGGSLSLKPEARCLLEYRTPRGPGQPALAVSFQEKGKTAWLCGRGLWRWGFLPPNASTSSDLYPQFLLGLVRWAAEPAVRDRFQVTPAKRVFQNGEPMAFSASLWDENYAPISDARIELLLRPAAEDATARPVSLVLDSGSEPGQYEGQSPGPSPGIYTFSAVARRTGASAPLGQIEGRVVVEAMGPELARTWSDREQLSRIARGSGGVSVEVGGIADLLDRIPRALRGQGRIREWEVWNHWLVFAAFTTVLCVEWFLRRRRGLA